MTSKALIPLLVILMNTAFMIKPSAQRIDYDDLFEEMSYLTIEQAYSRFFNYQRQNPYFANTYIQLANLSEKIFKERDPFREVELVNFWANNAILYYDLFPVYLQSNEVRRNREYYANIPVEASGRRLNNEDVLEFVNERIQYCGNYKDSLMLIFEALETSKDHYNNCVRIFNNINNDYINLNEALLKTDSAFSNSLFDLNHEFSATIEKFSIYKDLIEKFPLAGYDQNYKLRTIKTFRLDGITNTDFLLDTFYLWDYGQWINEFSKTFENDIVTLRNEIAEIHDMYDKNLEMLLAMEFADPEINMTSFDRLFLFRLGKYDNNSLIRELFNFFDVRQDYILLSKSEHNNPADSISALMNRKLRYYYRLAMHLNESKKELGNLYNSITTDNISRFNEYFNQYFSGEEGLREYYFIQNSFLDQCFYEGLDNLGKYFENERYYRTLFGYAEKSEGVYIPLFPAELASQDSIITDYITVDVSYIQSVPVYISGYKKSQNDTKPFVAKISEDFNIEWIQLIDIEDNVGFLKNKTAGNIYAYENGVIAIVTAKIATEDDDVHENAEEQQEFDDEVLDDILDEDDEMESPEKIEIKPDLMYKNVLVHFDNSGDVIFKEVIDNTGYPVYLSYDEINRLSLIAFREKDTLYKGLYNEITLCQADSAGVLNWTTPLNAYGGIVAVVRAEDKYIAYINSLQEEIIDDKVNNNWGLLIADISFDGNSMKTLPVRSSNSFYIDRVFSISSDEINLLGYSGKPEDKKGNMKYLILTADGELIFHNFE